ncbi:putative histone acetyltransferase [Neoconidiobolus thromboides FSU 785]|nr:putative histone acetyltransferase [Neoconidiobolus thromboides FSU 785]
MDKKKLQVQEELDGLIEFKIIRNDNSPLSMILLTGLKIIFQKQLPKMPKEYISRLVYDRNHTSMAIVVKNTLRVLGGITYRLFNHREFSEIVFCAIASSEQVKGYGSHLMNHLKDHTLRDTNAKHFLTYADNYAIGYFKKQGFTKEISLPEPIWMGYIKDYEGGTLMQCSMLPQMEYLDGNAILQLQKEIVNEKIQTMSSSHIKYPGLNNFDDGESSVPPEAIPGLIESGYDPSKDRLRPPPRTKLQNQMLKLISEMVNHNTSWPFLEPVDLSAVPDYLTVVKHPMDLSTLERNVEDNLYPDKESFLHDAYLIFENARTYNDSSTPYFKAADKLEEFLTKRVDLWTE